MGECVCVLSCVQLFVTPWTIACQAHLSIEFSSQEYLSGLPLPTLLSQGIFPTQGSNLSLLHHLQWQGGFFTTVLHRKITVWEKIFVNEGFPGYSVVKESAWTCRSLRSVGSVPGLGRTLGGGNRSPLQNFCLENYTERRAWPATVHGVAELGTTEQLSRSISMMSNKGLISKLWASQVFSSSPHF